MIFFHYICTTLFNIRSLSWSQLSDITYIARYVSYLDLSIQIWQWDPIENKTDDFDFPIFLSYVTTFLQHLLIVSVRAVFQRFVHCLDFIDRYLLLIRKLQNQRFKVINLKSSLRTFYGRHHDLIICCRMSVFNMTACMFRLSLWNLLLSSYSTYVLQDVYHE